MFVCTFTLNEESLSKFEIGGAKYDAFSGDGNHRNKVSAMCVPDLGPISIGTYYIVQRTSGGRLGRLRDLLNDHTEWFALYAKDGVIDDVSTFCEGVARGAFRLHPKGPLGISQGCIVIDRKTDFDLVRSTLLATTGFTIPDTGIQAYGVVNVVGLPVNNKKTEK
ncbi:MAG: DUF2778 domain-containing protein [Azoarcus sp.]|jgi:hypothetical protein|nr:DUF2778 domain-containing protein [Azoarcus sp.]